MDLPGSAARGGIDKPRSRRWLTALLLVIGYYCGAMIGFALTFEPAQTSILWPPNPVLLAALLMTPVNWWWLLFLSVLPVHLAVQLRTGIPIEMALAWFISNCSEAFIGAACVRGLLKERLRFDSFRHVAVFLFFCVFLAPFISSFLDVAFLETFGWREGGYWQLWRLRFFSNALATLTIAPALLSWNRNALPSLRKAPLLRRLEGGLLALALLSVSIVVFISGRVASAFAPLLLYAPLPLLLWAAVRFNPFAANVSFLLFASLGIWGTLLGHGPFVNSSPSNNVLTIQLFLIGVSVPLLLLAAAIKERRRPQESLRDKEEKLGLAPAAARISSRDRDMRENKGSWPLDVDITGCRLAEATAREKAALHESEARFRQMTDTMPQIVRAARADGYADDANRKWRELADIAEQPAGDETWLPFVHADDRRRCLDLWRRAVRNGEAFKTEYRILFPTTGVCQRHRVRALPVRNEAGSMVHRYSTVTDIDDKKRAGHALQAMRRDLEHRVAERTSELRRANDVLKAEIEERRKAQEAERQSEARFSKIFRLSPDAMCISYGIDGRILDVNERWENLFGYESAEVIGITAQQLNLYASEKDSSAVIERNRASGAIRDLEVKMRNKAGAIRQAAISGEAIAIGDVPCFITIIRDMTEQRRAESESQRQREQLTHLTRVVVLGELSGALVHELNQPLAAILTNAQAAQRFMLRDPVDLREIRDILDDIVEEDKRAGEVIRRLRALFMKGEPKRQPLNFNEVVCETLDLAQSDLIARKVTVKLQLGSDLEPVQGDRVQLQQVLLNLIVNACEAMSSSPPGARRLTVLTGTGVDGNVHIAVSDTGPGIAPDLLDQIFESFFTTKVHGLGFGLSISHAIIAEHGGRIEASNNPGGGATFRITLPAHLESCHER